MEGKVPSPPSSAPSVHEKRGRGRDERRGGIGGEERPKKEGKFWDRKLKIQSNSDTRKWDYNSFLSPPTQGRRKEGYDNDGGDMSSEEGEKKWVNLR